MALPCKDSGEDSGREDNAEQCEDDDDCEEDYTNDNKSHDKENSSHGDSVAQIEEISNEEVAIIANDLYKLSEHTCNLIRQEMKQLEKHHKFKKMLSDTILIR